VVFRVMLRRLVGMLLGLNGVAMRRVRVVGGRFVIPGFVVLGRFHVVLRGFLVMVCSLLVMLRALMVSHGCLLIVCETLRTRAAGRRNGTFRGGLIGRRLALVRESWVTIGDGVPERPDPPGTIHWAGAIGLVMT